jgi:ABC-type Zn uptake system ZnuABC Zn-binding protein ZnuA
LPGSPIRKATTSRSRSSSEAQLKPELARVKNARVQETSLITNPATDPHAYEPTPTDARVVAGAGVFIQNGIGYDPWADKMLAANPVPGRTVLNVGQLVGAPDGGRRLAGPHGQRGCLT